MIDVDILEIIRANDGANPVLWATIDPGGTTCTIDGGEPGTPFATTVPVQAGDRVQVQFANGEVVTVGNVTHPPAGSAHFWHDQEGAHVSSAAGSTSGGNVLIDTDSVDIRDGSEVLASFDADGLSLPGHNVTVGSDANGHGVFKSNTGFAVSYTYPFGNTTYRGGVYSDELGTESMYNVRTGANATESSCIANAAGAGLHVDSYVNNVVTPHYVFVNKNGTISMSDPAEWAKAIGLSGNYGGAMFRFETATTPTAANEYVQVPVTSETVGYGTDKPTVNGGSINFPKAGTVRVMCQMRFSGLTANDQIVVAVFAGETIYLNSMVRAAGANEAVAMVGLIPVTTTTKLSVRFRNNSGARGTSSNDQGCRLTVEYV